MTACITGNQAMMIVSFRKVSPLDIFQKDVLESISTIFMTAAVLRALQSMIFLLTANSVTRKKGKKKKTAILNYVLLSK